MGKIDWSNLLQYVWHLALIGGSAYLAIAHPQMAPMLQPFLQAAGQLTPPPPGVTILK